MKIYKTRKRKQWEKSSYSVCTNGKIVKRQAVKPKMMIGIKGQTVMLLYS